WDCVLWQEQPKANSIQDSWCDAVVDGEHVAIARQKLRRHLLATRIPEDQRARARTLLRRDPDAVEVAMLAETSDASAGERSYAAQARWVLGRAERSTPGEVHWLQLGVGETVACDGRSILVELGSAMGLVLLGFGDQGEMILRS